MAVMGLVLGLAVQGASVGVPVPAAPQSCLAMARAVDAGQAQWPTSIDGKTLKSSSKIESLRKARRDGSLLLIEGGDFSAQSFGGDFRNVCFRDVRLAKTKWSGKSLSGVGFINSDLTNARMRKAVLTHVLLRNTTVVNADMQDAVLSGGQMDGSWEASAAGWNLARANLKGFRFACGKDSSNSCAFDRKNIVLTDADLTNASIYSFPLWEGPADNIIINKTEIGLDQVARMSRVRFAGPIIVREGMHSVEYNPVAFNAMRAALTAPEAKSTNCATVDTPLRKAICEEPTGELARMERENQRLYSTMIPDSSIVSTAQQAFLTDLETCAAQSEEASRSCLKVEFQARREDLIEQLIDSKPLEPGEEALYVREDTPHLRAVIAARSAIKLAPILADSATSYMLLVADDDGVPSGYGFAQDKTGKRCITTLQRGKIRTMSIRAWVTGADFKTIVPKGKAATPPPNTCPIDIDSGPMVRIPIEAKDFDKLLASARNTAGF
jgi:hypothetical protein